jgi:hypothetical protein
VVWLTEPEPELSYPAAFLSAAVPAIVRRQQGAVEWLLLLDSAHSAERFVKYPE